MLSVSFNLREHNTILIIVTYYNDFIGATLLQYTPNGTDRNEIHWVGNDMNVRYFQNFSFYQNNIGLINYQELDVTS